MAAARSLKQRITDGEVVVALRPPITSSRDQLEAALSKGRYDLIYLDGQHTPFSDDQLVALCGAAEGLGLPVQFRIPHTRHTYLIGRYLDMGLSGVLVPEVEDDGPGRRGHRLRLLPPGRPAQLGGAARFGTRPAGRRLGATEYAAWWNQHVVLAVQLESITAVESARALAKPGVDYLAFGPSDLTFDLARHPEYRFRTADDCTRYVAEQVRGTGIRLGMAVVTEPEARAKYVEMGLTVFQETPRP